ncbi:MAG: PAS domain S-box protein [Polyangiaceae bacterium]|jgi:PAS domain S-box-containing protein
MGSEPRFRALVENSPDAIVLTAADGTTLYASPAVERISGRVPSRWVGNEAFESVHPADRERVSSAMGRIRATPSERVTFECRLRHRDGSYRWIEAIATNLLADPSVAAIVAFLHDATPRRERSDSSRGVSDVRRSEERLRVLSKTTQAFSEAGRSPDRLFDAVVREIAEALGCACILSLLTEDGRHFTTAHVHTSDAELLAVLRDHFVASGPRRVDSHPGLKHVVDTHTPFFMPDVDGSLERLQPRAEPDVLHFARTTAVKSALVVPLRVRGTVLGALGLTRHGAQAPALSEHDLALAQSLAEHAALAVTATRLVAESERELAERERMAVRLRLLADASHEFADVAGDYARLTAVVARRLGEIIGDLCAIRAVSEDGATLESGAVYHRDPGVVAWADSLLASRPQRVGDGVMGGVAASAQPVFLPRVTTSDYAASSAPAYREILDHLAVGSVIVVPMQCRGKVVGVAALLRSGSESPYTDSDFDLVRNLADHAALAIANARSYAAERAALARAVGANQALQESEVAHRLLFEASPIPLFVFDVETFDILAANDAMVRLYGYSHGELMTMKVVDLRLPADRDSAKRIITALDEAETVGTARHCRKDGSLFFIEYVSRVLAFGVAGRRARITVVTDMTARHEAEAMAGLLAAIVQSSNDAIVSQDLDGTIMSWNVAAEQLFGYSAAEAVGMPIGLLIPADRRAEERGLIRLVSEGDRVERHETIRRRKDGTEVAVSLSLAPIFNGSGKVVAASKSVRDLTQQRKADAALRSTEDQLRQAQKMEAIGRLAGGIAHDFNNILSVILSYSEMGLAEMAPTDAMSEGIGEIHKAALRAAELTRQLLLFSRQQVVAPKVLDLNQVLAGMDKLLKRIVGEDVDLVSVPAPGLGRVFVDPGSVEQVVMNLVVNARDAMPHGGKLTLETANIDLDGEYARQHLGTTPGPHVMLAVSDTGIGMDLAVQARIFEPFFTTKEAGKGTGLGLSTVFGIAQQAGGSVGVYSEPGKGSTFKVYFPRVEAETSAVPSIVQRASLRGSETVLLVEDQEQVRAVAHGILKRMGYDVIVAAGAHEALLRSEKLRRPIHLLLTDVVMPEMSGAELAKRIAPGRPDMKVLFMSGYTDDSIVRHGVLESEMAFLQKPFTPESMARKVRETLNAPESAATQSKKQEA